MWRSTVGCIVLALSILVAPCAAVAKPPAKVPRIGFLTDSARRAEAEDMRQALRELGYVEGQTIAFAWRFADTPAQYPTLVAELVDFQVDVIVVPTGLLALAAKHVTQTIPIVMAGSGDAVGQGLVASLARPGGNVTGLTSASPDLSQKRLQLLKEAVPTISRVAVFWCPMVAGQPNVVNQLQWRELHVAAQGFGLHLQSLEVRSPDEDFEALFAAAVRERADALMTVNCVYTNLAPAPERIAGLAATHRLPGMYWLRSSVEAGGLMSYVPNLANRWRRAAVYVDKILKGANPATLPVEQPMRFDFVINLKTAEALGLTLPPHLLVFADEVIR